MLVKKVMHKNANVISRDMTLKHAAIIMQKKNFGFLPVKHNSKIIGVITDRDIIIRAISKGKDPNKIKLKDAMTKKIHFCYESDDINKAASLMSKKKINRLAVYNKKKKLTGILSLGDIARKCTGSLCSKVTKAIRK